LSPVCARLLAQTDRRAGAAGAVRPHLPPQQDPLIWLGWTVRSALDSEKLATGVAVASSERSEAVPIGALPHDIRGSLGSGVSGDGVPRLLANSQAVVPLALTTLLMS